MVHACCFVCMYLLCVKHLDVHPSIHIKNTPPKARQIERKLCGGGRRARVYVILPRVCPQRLRPLRRALPTTQDRIHRAKSKNNRVLSHEHTHAHARPSHTKKRRDENKAKESRQQTNEHRGGLEAGTKNGKNLPMMDDSSPENSRASRSTNEYT